AGRQQLRGCNRGVAGAQTRTALHEKAVTDGGNGDEDIAKSHECRGGEEETAGSNERGEEETGYELRRGGGLPSSVEQTAAAAAATAAGTKEVGAGRAHATQGVGRGP
ncbi:unnamed protein product, partial [Laminaria digitata]